ncbi:HEAT repeat domain-containing protein [Frigoriglobus tundricola]|uniref:Cytochrome c domain-containing protein n=1 Tax=Frigoriglobus tundricola TaxID=2774151 RepID=A0A6M5Z050_9BACT|nr:hypothetical protein [Frigoriglobus tundricola]QJW99086.1 hypothetical protein FTUN_6684 [Frigoriglobus tundricola]
MARCLNSGRCVVPLAAVTLLAMAGNSLAQQPASQPVLPPLPSFPVPNVPSPVVPDLPPLPPPSVGTAQTVPPQLTVAPSLPPLPPTSQRFYFQIDPSTPVKNLLPPPPKSGTRRGPVLTDDLTKVPEVAFQAKPDAPDKAVEQAAHQLAKINHLNAKRTDAFMTELLEARADLAGLPFVMGDDCRTSGERAKQFTIAATTVRQALNHGVQNFWNIFGTLCDQQDAARSKTDKALAAHVTVARIAALMQMFAAESPELRLGLVKYLTGVAQPEATKALARLAIFTSEDDVRLAAVDALKVRREKDYTEILVNGLRCPWPAVAKRAADAIARLEREDLIPELVKLLEVEDPRLPQAKRKGWVDVPVVREMVKLNHHQNCVMCHAPAGSGVVSASAITAEVAVLGQPLPTPAEGYRKSTPELMIRVDVTYLRPDFSAVLAVGDAHPWPEEQRFDFLVRERQLTNEEAATYHEKLTPKGAGVLSPYHKAALAALRDMTGKDAAPTAAAWRELLGSR